MPQCSGESLILGGRRRNIKCFTPQGARKCRLVPVTMVWVVLVLVLTGVFVWSAEPVITKAKAGAEAESQREGRLGAAQEKAMAPA